MRDGGAVYAGATPGDFTSIALSCLFVCSYFRRGWILQEVILPKFAELFWGEARIDYSWFSRATIDLRGRYGGCFSGDALAGMEAVRQIQYLRDSLHSHSKKCPFAGLVLRACYQTFSDPRDHIYGLLGLQKICHDMPFKHPLFQPDYSSSHLDCYKSAAQTLLIEREDIGILSLVAHRKMIDDE
jgi:hypothetical protein